MGLIKRLKFVVPTLQVLLLVSAGLWQHILGKYYADHPEVIVQYASTPIIILLKSNFPLAVLWFPFFCALNWASSGSHLNLTSGAAGVVMLAVFDLVVVSTVALFWYFVVVEVEKRKHGASLIRFSNRMLETLKAIVLIAAGLGAFGFACWETHRLLLLGQLNLLTLYWSSMVDAIVGGLFLVIWAVVLIKISVQDLMLAFWKT
jgi:hypothetical protein